jgi:hypothetical protein
MNTDSNIKKSKYRKQKKKKKKPKSESSITKKTKWVAGKSAEIAKHEQKNKTQKHERALS